jgi:imidazolonepropionase-like amidohydrolase
MEIRDGRIVAIGSAEAGSPQDVVDLGDVTLLPGFIDSHVHIGFARPADVLRGGVTVTRDLGWPRDIIFALQRESSSADFDGPLIVAAGQMLTAPGGYPSRAGWAPRGTACEVRGPSEAEAAVATQAEAGASVIKIALNPPVGPTLDGDTLEAIVRHSHARGLRVTGHVHGLKELEKALGAGVDELAHMLMGDDLIPSCVIETMVTQGMVVVPTISVRFGSDRRKALDNLRRFVSSGGRVLYGTDLGNSGPRPGIDRREVKGMARAGMSGRDIIRSATTEAARILGLAGRGRLSEGAAADVVAVRGNPLDHPTALLDVAFVMREGIVRRRDGGRSRFR